MNTGFEIFCVFIFSIIDIFVVGHCAAIYRNKINTLKEVFRKIALYYLFCSVFVFCCQFYFFYYGRNLFKYFFYTLSAINTFFYFVYISKSLNELTEISEATTEIKSLQIIKRFFDDWIDYVNVPIFIASRDGRCLSCNLAYKNLVGYRKSDLIGDGWIQTIAPQDRNHVLNKWSEMVNKDLNYYSMANRYLCFDGSEIEVRVRAFKLKNSIFLGIVEKVDRSV